MKRAFIGLVWNIATTEITGPYDDAATARSSVSDEVAGGSREGDWHGAILGPFPIQYLDDEPEIPRDLQASDAEEAAAKVADILNHASNTAGVPLKELISRIEIELGDWSENLENEGGMPLTMTFGRALADNFTETEIKAFYEAAHAVGRPAATLRFLAQAYEVAGGDLTDLPAPGTQPGGDASLLPSDYAGNRDDFSGPLAQWLRPSELEALYEQAKADAGDNPNEADAGRLVYIREAYRRLTGDEL